MLWSPMVLGLVALLAQLAAQAVSAPPRQGGAAVGAACDAPARLALLQRGTQVARALHSETAAPLGPDPGGGAAGEDLPYGELEVRLEELVDHFPTVVGDSLLLSPGARLPALMRRFDWVVGWPVAQDPKLWPRPSAAPDGEPLPPEHTLEVGEADPFAHGIHDPRTVLVCNDRLDDLLRHAAAHFEGGGRVDRALLIVGDWNLTFIAAQRRMTVPEMVAGIREFFPNIWLVARDVDIPGTHTMPVPFESMYLRGVAGPAAAAAVAAASLEAKSRPVLAAWGRFCPGVETDCADEGRFACASRASARSWATRPSSKALGVEVMTVPPDEYWRELARTRFLLSPTGYGIQSSKTMEALAVLTVPIVQRGSFPVCDDLVRRGFPIAVVDEWDDITPRRLEDWWAALSPRLESFRSNCLTTDYFWRLFTGQAQFCA